MSRQFIGWDIGGAHVKAARLDSKGEILQVIQSACPLWKGLDFLDNAVGEVLNSMGEGEFKHAVTMTGELVDCFSGREQGVSAIINAMQSHLGADLLIYAGQHGLLPVQQVQTCHTLSIASANWLASVQLASEHCQDALFVDIGSTTTDLLLINQHQLRLRVLPIMTD